MSDDQDDSGSQRLNAILAAYLQSMEAGRPPSRDELLAQHPELADELREFTAQHEALEGLAAGLGKGVRTHLYEAPSGPSRQMSPDPFSEATLPPADSQAEMPQLGAKVRYFGDYELLEEIARGGMGVVYKARQMSLNRIVALKMILAGQLASDEDVQRFHAEAEAAANLDHPGIVPIYEVGDHEGRQYFSMGYVEGQSLADKLQGGPLSPREAAECTRQVAETIAFAHRQGVIHRDLKPSNVLLDRSGTPKVTDFGLAKKVQDGRGLTATGQILGTPSYMPPEQAAGKVSEIKEPADIYSLGAILYALVTGRPPFQSDNPFDTLRQVLEAEPAPPRLLNAAVDRDLQTICLKCLEKSPQLRYPSAQALADDLQRFLDGEPIAAQSQHLLNRVTHAIGRRRHEDVFQGWGRAITLLGLIVLVTHVVMFTLESFEYGVMTSYWLPRLVMFTLLAANIAFHRPQSFLPINAAERLIWALWIGFFLGLGACNLLLVATGLPFHLNFPLSVVLGGLCFFVMGVHVWGGCFLIGFAFWLMVPVLAMTPRYSSLEYGVLWAIAFVLLGAHYWTQHYDPELPR